VDRFVGLVLSSGSALKGPEAQVEGEDPRELRQGAPEYVGGGRGGSRDGAKLRCCDTRTLSSSLRALTLQVPGEEWTIRHRTRP